jgi:hypothetical protein
LLKAKVNKILELVESSAKEKEKVMKLTKELSLVNESNAQLKGENETLHENFLCLHAKHTDLEVANTRILKWNMISLKKATPLAPMMQPNPFFLSLAMVVQGVVI